MKRDMDLARRILLEIEEYDSARAPGIEFDGYTAEQIGYHIGLLGEAGLLDVIDTSSMNGISFIPYKLTWDGHEFLDAARDEGRWNKAMQTIKEKTGTVTFGVLVAYLIALTKEALGITD